LKALFKKLKEREGGVKQASVGRSILDPTDTAVVYLKFENESGTVEAASKGSNSKNKRIGA